MDWLKNRTVQRFGVVGFLGGLLVMIVGFWLEFNQNHLPLAWWAFPYVHRTQPLMFMLDLAPIVFGIMAGLLGLQYSLSGTIARGKKEWEATFDSFSDLIFVVNAQGNIARCNQAVIDRLSTTYKNVIGKPIAEILVSSEETNTEEPHGITKGFSWSGRLYEVSVFPIQF
jgi:PAS domain-containing protein